METLIAQSAVAGPPQVQGTRIDRSTSSVADEMRNLAASQANKATLTPKQLVGGLAGVFLLALVLSAWSKVAAVLLMALVPLGAVYTAKTHLTKIAAGVTGGLLLLALVALVWPGKVEEPRAEAPPPKPSTAAAALASSPSALAQPAPEPAQVLEHPAADGTPVGQETPQEERKRLKARHFIAVSPEALAWKLKSAWPDWERVFETKYQGNYVRWRGKYERKGMLLVKFIANSGRLSAFSCEDFDPAQEGGSFFAAKWEDIVVEGRLEKAHDQLDKASKTEFVLTECIARMAHQ
jgi:hypothetical protein